MLRERKEQRERLWVSLLWLYHKAWSPGNPLSAGPAYCASAEEPCFISLCSSSTLTSKLINSRLLFPPLVYEGVSIKLSPLLRVGCVTARNHGTQEAATISHPLRTLASTGFNRSVWWDRKLSTAYKLRAWNWPLNMRTWKKEDNL